jgi:Ca2+-binding RTX toxin-like protein
MTFAKFTAKQTTTYSLYESATVRGFTAGDDAHDGYPGWTPEPPEVHGDGGNDVIDLSKIAFDLKIYGFAGNDEIYAGFGEDLVVGGLGNDSLYGNGGFDTLVGGDGNDFLSGGADDDHLHAGDGLDQINGGTGDDFIFLTDDDQTDLILFNPGDGMDVIDGFETGVDKISLSLFGLSDLGGGDAIIFTGLDGPLGWEDFL